MKMKIAKTTYVEKEVLPCPFCGYTEPVLKNYIPAEKFYVMCEVCEGVGPKDKTEEKAVDKWNERHYFRKGE